MWNDWSKEVRIAATKCLGKTGNGKVLNYNDKVILFITLVPQIISYFYWHRRNLIGRVWRGGGKGVLYKNLW